MSEPGRGSDQSSGLGREEMHSALFAQMIVQQSNMALMLLGKVPDPQSGQTVRDLDAARLFIDQLEVLQAKTKGNLTREEEGLLKHTLMSLHLAFVEAVESPEPAGQPADAGTAPGASVTPPAPTENKTAPPPNAGPATEETSGKRFSKKYSD